MLRKEKGLTLEQVGDYVGVGKSTVRKWECGTIQNIRRDKIEKLAAILETTPDYLMRWQEKPDGLDLTESEVNLVLAYRKHPEMQNVVDKILDLSNNEE
ncbi:MAG: helix-turn-helix domain-containing protein [Ruminococcus sp.]|nr:helix-turn-helix domain-containing protein [Ruminococcus sp.]